MFKQWKNQGTDFVIDMGVTYKEQCERLLFKGIECFFAANRHLQKLQCSA